MPVKRVLDIILTLLFVLSVAALFLANEDPWARKALCNVVYCPHIYKAGHKIVYDLALGFLTSILFYALVVRLPDYEHRQRLKRSLARHYRQFREDCIEIMLQVASTDPAEQLPCAKSLVEQNSFKAYFGSEVAEGRTRWNDVFNNMESFDFQQLPSNMEIFREELVFVLNNIDIQKTEPFESAKRLSVGLLLNVKYTTFEYDELKPLERFLWSVFAGGDPIYGYRERDMVQEMIDEI